MKQNNREETRRGNREEFKQINRQNPIQRDRQNTRQTDKPLSKQNDNGRSMDPREKEIRDQRAARREAALRRKRNKQIKQITNYIKLGLVCGGLCIILAVFVFKTPIETGTKSLQNGNYIEAIENFSKGLNDIDHIAESYKGIGIAYYELGQYKDAIENLENAVQKGQSSMGSTYYLLAISYMEVGDYENALKHITSALTKSGNSEELTKELRFNEVLCMEMSSDWIGAKAKATSYLQSYPDDVAMAEEYEFLSSR